MSHVVTMVTTKSVQKSVRDLNRRDPAQADPIRLRTGRPHSAFTCESTVGGGASLLQVSHPTKLIWIWGNPVACAHSWSFWWRSLKVMSVRLQFSLKQRQVARRFVDDREIHCAAISDPANIIPVRLNTITCLCWCRPVSVNTQSYLGPPEEDDLNPVSAIHLIIAAWHPSTG